MNSYFTIMEPGVRDFEGFVYQFIGDEIMGLFPLDKKGYADNAVRSAISLQNQILLAYNQGRERAGYDPIQIGVGINTGPVAIGIAGTPERLDACALGNTVNVAARCQTLTKDYDADIIITEHTLHHLRQPDAFDIRSLGAADIRGMEQKMHIYGVYNHPDV
jgi:class 3 adenylate cyclase